MHEAGVHLGEGIQLVGIHPVEGIQMMDSLAGDKDILEEGMPQGPEDMPLGAEGSARAQQHIQQEMRTDLCHCYYALHRPFCST